MLALSATCRLQRMTEVNRTSHVDRTAIRIITNYMTPTMVIARPTISSTCGNTQALLDNFVNPIKCHTPIFQLV